MSNRIIYLLLFTLLSLHVQGSQRYQASIEQSRWELKATPLRCELNHPIPRYGVGQFVHQFQAAGTALGVGPAGPGQW